MKLVSRAARRYLVAFACTAVVCSCQDTTVVWSEAVPLSTTEGHIALDRGGRVIVLPPTASPPALPGGPTRCEGSYRFAWLDSARVYAAWWAPRPDRSASLLGSYSEDSGSTWRPAAVVDSSDVGAVGCARPAPGIAGDGANVHVVYSLTSSEGTGIFFAHSMDRASVFHAPVPIVYGERLGAAAVGAQGDEILVAYEDLNDPSQIGLAISRTMGHIFERRTPVASGVGRASAPDLALAGRTVAVSWLQRAAADSLRAVRLLRVGHLR